MNDNYVPKEILLDPRCPSKYGFPTSGALMTKLAMPELLFAGVDTQTTREASRWNTRPCRCLRPEVFLPLARSLFEAFCADTRDLAALYFGVRGKLLTVFAKMEEARVHPVDPRIRRDHERLVHRRIEPHVAVAI